LFSLKNNTNLTSEEIKTAISLREQYKKSDIAILESNEIIKFNVSKDEKNVEVLVISTKN